MDTDHTICACGQSRFQLADDQPCPECGQIQFAKPKEGTKRGLLRGRPSTTAVISCIFSLVTFGVSTILTIVIVMMMMSLAHNKGAGAPIGLILPVYGYLFVLLPAVGITGLIAIIPTKGRHWPLAMVSLITIAVSAVIPVLTFLVSLLLI